MAHEIIKKDLRTVYDEQLLSTLISIQKPRDCLQRGGQIQTDTLAHWTICMILLQKKQLLCGLQNGVYLYGKILSRLASSGDFRHAIASVNKDQIFLGTWLMAVLCSATQ